MRDVRFDHNMPERKKGTDMEFEFSKMTNFDFLRTLSAEEFSHLFTKLRLDSAEESDWLEWMNMPCKKDEWEEILK